MLRSARVQNILGLDENYIVNLQLLREGVIYAVRVLFHLMMFLKNWCTLVLVSFCTWNAEIVKKKVQSKRMTLTELENVDRRLSWTREQHQQCSILVRGIAISTQTYLSLAWNWIALKPNLQRLQRKRTRGWIGCRISRQRKLYTLQGKGKRWAWYSWPRRMYWYPFHMMGRGKSEGKREIRSQVLELLLESPLEKSSPCFWRTWQMGCNLVRSP